MLSSVKDLPAVKEMLATAKGLLGWDLMEVCVSGPAAKLQQPEISHPALFIAGLAAWEQLKATLPEIAARPGAVAGLDVGEYAALVAAGVLPFEDALRIVKLHGEAVAEASKQPAQAILSVAGVRCRKLETMCKGVADESGQVCCITNELFPKGATCGGHLEAMQRLEKVVKEGGALQAKLVNCGALH